MPNALDLTEAAKTLLATYKDHAGIVNTLWNIFQIVSFAVLGLVYKDDHLRFNPRVLVALSAGFLAFAFGNREAMMRSQDVVHATALQLQAKDLTTRVAPVLRPVLESHRAPSSGKLRQGHYVFTALVVSALWLPWVIQKVRAQPT